MTYHNTTSPAAVTFTIITVFHVDRIKRYQPANPELFPNHVQNLRPDPDIVDGVEMYEVEDILAERRVRKRGHTSLQYLVKWKGFTTAEASWEYAVLLRGAAEVVRGYKVRKQQQEEEDEARQDEEEGHSRTPTQRTELLSLSGGV